VPGLDEGGEGVADLQVEVQGVGVPDVVEHNLGILGRGHGGVPHPRHLLRRARCYGVDLNRNWDTIGFGLGATSTNPCRETYRGSEPSSEPETKAVATALLAIKDKVRIYLSFHSYGQYWLTSWGYKTSLPLDNDKLVRLGRQAVEAIQCVTPNRRYTIGSAGAIFYIAGGASDDYAKATAHIPYSFTVELPDTGSNGFLLPANQISTVGRELWAATSVLAKEAARHNMGPDPALAADPASYSDQ